MLQAADLVVALLLLTFQAMFKELIVAGRGARKFGIEVTLQVIAHRFRFVYRLVPVLMELFGPGFGFAAGALSFLLVIGFGSFPAGIQAGARPANRGGQSLCRRSGHKPAEPVKRKHAGEARDEGDGRLRPGENASTKTRNQRNSRDVSDQEQRNKQPERKQTEEQRQRGNAEPTEFPFRLSEQRAEFLKETVFVCRGVGFLLFPLASRLIRPSESLSSVIEGAGWSNDAVREVQLRGRFMGRVEQALEPGVSAQGGPRFAFQDSQSILFTGQLSLKAREVPGGPFRLGFLMAAGLQQLALDFVDLPSFVTFDALEVLFPGGGLGAEHSGFALAVAGFKSLFTG